MSIVLFLSLFTTSSFAADCSTVTNHLDFFTCSLQRHPELELSKLRATEADAAVSAASQWQNPELALKSTSGSNAGSSVSNTEVSLLIPVSQLWTRSAKTTAGKAEQQLIQLESTERFLNVKKALIKDVFRLRQVEDESHTIEESIEAFNRIKSQLRSRKARGPEQEITLNLVELASSDYDLKLNGLNIERSEISSRLKALWPQPFEIKKSFLPPLKIKWPALPQQVSVGQSFEVRRTNAQAERARAENNLAVSQSWPTLSVGPTIEQTKDGGTEFTSYGVNATLSLPLFSTNSGVRNLTQSRYQQAILQENFANKKAELEKNILLERYRMSVASLSKFSRQSETHRKHSTIDKLFRQGLASGSLIIEAHRQISEYTESLHKNEIAAVDAYLEIKTLSGDGNLEEILQ